MTDPDGRRNELRDEQARIVSEYDQLLEEYERTKMTADPIRNRVAAAEREWKPLVVDWDELQKPRDWRTIAERGRVFSERERIAAERRRVYPELAAAMNDQVEIDFRIARLETDLHNLAAKHHEIRRLLAEMDESSG